jgi:hypothetical protein
MAFYPFRVYLRAFLVCTISLPGVVLLASPSSLLELGTAVQAMLGVMGVVYFLGFVSVLPVLIAKPKVCIDRQNILNYRYGRVLQSVNLNRLTSCDYGFQEQRRGFPRRVFLLYDAYDNAIALPATWWWHGTQLQELLRNAVLANHVKTTAKTAKKLRAKA